MRCSIILLLTLEILAVASARPCGNSKFKLSFENSGESSCDESLTDETHLQARSPGRKRNGPKKGPNQRTQSQAPASQVQRSRNDNSLTAKEKQSGGLETSTGYQSRKNTAESRLAGNSSSRKIKSEVSSKVPPSTSETQDHRLSTGMGSLTITSPAREDNSGAIVGPMSSSGSQSQSREASPGSSRQTSPRSSQYTSPSSSRPSSPTKPSTPRDQEYLHWLRLNDEGIQQAMEPPSRSTPSTDEKLKQVALLKLRAKRTRAQERIDLAESQRIMAGRRANSPTSRAAITKVVASAERAVLAGSASTMAQNEAVLHYTNTDRQHMVPDMIKAAARDLTRSKARASHRAAMQAEWVSKIFAENAAGLRDHDPQRGPAYSDAASSRREFHSMATQYYKDQHEYKHSTWYFGGGNSSSDEDRVFDGVPRP